MVQPTIQDLAAQVRLESGLRNNQVLSDADLYSFISEAYSDLRDRLIVRFAYWFRQEVSFTLTSDSPGNIFDLTTIPDFQMAQGLDMQVSTGVFYTVPVLASYAERNAFNGTWPFLGQTWGYNGILGRKYFIDGDNLEVLPAQNAAGQYRLVYTPIQTMAAKVTVTGSFVTGDHASNSAGFEAIQITGLPFLADYANQGTVTATFEAPNTAYNGTFSIAQALPGSGTQLVTTTAYPGGSFTNPATGNWSVTYQPIGTVDTLPAKLIPWSQYLVLYAAIAVRNSRNQDPTALLARFADIKQRVIDLTKQRTEGVRQAPITQGRYGFPGNGGGFGMGN